MSVSASFPSPRSPSPVTAPRVLALATASPEHEVDQPAVAAAASSILLPGAPDLARLLPVFARSGVVTRQMVRPPDWYASPLGWPERLDTWARAGLPMLVDATRAALAEAGMAAAAVDAVVMVSTTGFAAPSLDVAVVGELAMRQDVQRLPVFGLGCAGGVIGLARAADLARARPGAVVLLLVLELCSVTFRTSDHRPSNMVASALFGDGAAAVLLRVDDAPGPRLGAGHEHTVPDSGAVMGWTMEDDGMGVVFSPEIPDLVDRVVPGVLDAFLASEGLTRAAVDGWIAHPGGAKVLLALGRVCGADAPGLDLARAVLARHGNMSAATVLFVLEQAIRRGLSGRHVMMALGPGFTVALQLLECDA